MRELTLDGKLVVLSPNSKIILTRETAVLGGRGSYSLPLLLPMAFDENRIATGHLYNIQAPGKRSREYDARFRYRGVPLLEGKAAMKESGDDYMELVLKGNDLDFYSRYSDVMLMGINWPSLPEFDYNNGARTLQTIATALQESLTTHKAYVAFEVIDESEQETRQTHWNYWEQGGQDFSTSYEGENPKYGYTGYLRLYAIFDYLFPALGFEVKENFLRATDDLKDIVMLNVFNILAAPSVTWGDLLPGEMSVSDFVAAWESAGIDFNINTADRSVTIRPKDEIFDQARKTEDRMVKNSLKVTPSEKDGFKLSMTGAADSFARTDLSEAYNTYETAVYIRENSALNTVDDLPAPLWEDVRFIKQEGLFYECYHNGSSYIWEVRTGLHQAVKEGGEENDPEVNITVAYSKLESRVDGGATRGKPVVRINVSDPIVISGILITCFRGMQDCYTISGTPVANTEPYPYANYVPYAPDGSDLAHTVDLSTGFFYGLQKRVLEHLTNSYLVEYKKRGTLFDFTELSLQPVLIRGQLSIIKTVSFPCAEHLEEVELTIIARVREIE